MSQFDINSAVGIALSNAEIILKRNMIKYHLKFPYQCATNGIYGVDQGFWADWHPGLYVGMYWDLYEITSDIKYKKYAERMGELVYNIISDGNIWHCDMGKLYLPVVLPDMKYNRNEFAKKVIVRAAECLMEKLVLGGKYMDTTYFDPHNRRKKRDYYIIRMPFLNNIHFLRLASEISGNNKYIKTAHIMEQSIFENNIKPDGSIKVAVSINKSDMSIRKTPLNDEMAFYQDRHRGFGWAIQTLASCYKTEQSEVFFEKFSLVLDYIEQNYVENMLYRPNDESKKHYYDSSAAAIMLSGLLEMTLNENADSHIRSRCKSLAMLLFEDLYNNSMVYAASGDECLLTGGYKFYEDVNYMPETSGTIPGDYYWLKSLRYLCEL